MGYELQKLALIHASIQVQESVTENDIKAYLQKLIFEILVDANFNSEAKKVKIQTPDSMVMMEFIESQANAEIAFELNEDFFNWDLDRIKYYIKELEAITALELVNL